MKLLSVVVPIYNVEKYLPECVDSIIRQTYTNLEIILVDDGSTDESGAIADRFCKKDTRIKVIHKGNGGLLSARYAGSIAAGGDYITFVDADDWIDSNMYSFLMNKIEIYNADLVTSGHYGYSPDGRLTIEYDKYIPEGIYEKNKIYSEIVPVMMWDARSGRWSFEPSTCLKIFQRDKLIRILERLKDKSFYYGEDSAITYMYVLSAERICCTNEPFYYHRQRESSHLPPYVVSDDFYRNLNDFYYFLYNEFKKHDLREVLMKQLDSFFVMSAKYKLVKYNFPKKSMPNYLFPFNKILPDSSFIIYGAGRTGRLYIQQVKKLNYGKLVAWVDKKCRIVGSDISSPEIVRKAVFDYIVIAIVPEDTVREVKIWLHEMGVADEKIIHQITEW